MTDPDKPVEVTQEDRDLFCFARGLGADDQLARIATGAYDDDRLMQRIARHRTRATASPRQDGVREALAALLAACEQEANERGGDYGPLIGPAANQAEAALSDSSTRASNEAPGLLHIAGNGQRLTTADVEAVAARVKADPVEASGDAARLLDFLAAIALDRATNEEGEARLSAWQPIRTAPRDGTWFIASATETGWRAMRIVRFRHDDDRLPTHGEGCWPSAPTHWMPLPAYPSTPSTDAGEA